MNPILRVASEAREWASWLNMVERFFRDLRTERLGRGAFASMPELVAAINDYVAHHNIEPKPLIWTKSARDIQQKIIRANRSFFCEALCAPRLRYRAGPTSGLRGGWCLTINLVLRAG